MLYSVIFSAFEQRSRVFQQNMKEFLKERPDRLTQFNDILEILEKTPVLPCLVTEGIICIGGDEDGSLDSGMTLMKWISSQVRDISCIKQCFHIKMDFELLMHANTFPRYSEPFSQNQLFTDWL